MALVERVVPDHVAQFSVEALPNNGEKDAFEIESINDKIVLRGSTAVCVASALYYYLNHYCSAQITWNGTNLNLPSTLPPVPSKVTKSSPYDYRYYLNYCTFSYTSPWWDWKRWEKEIDWMALHGINMPLAVLGQNSVWQRVYKSLGFTDDELQAFFSGPAYIGFNWMGVLDGWGGPFPASLMQSQEELQKKILQRQRDLGMIPVLPAFTGHVPPAFKTRFPASKVHEVKWGGFPPTLLLDPDDPMFLEIGEAFILQLTQTYGTDHYYSADTFIEMVPPSGDSDYLSSMGQKTYMSMAKADPEAVWVMQGWMFQYLSEFWKNTRIKALLELVPDNRMVILDLFSESKPAWQRTGGYFGKPWVWCMLHNFGGNISLHGRMEQVASGPANALSTTSSASLRGIGMTMEALEQNPVMYELMAENTWRDNAIDLDSWLKFYTRCRYGTNNSSADKAWKILKETVYDGTTATGGPESIITGRPTLAERTAFTRTALNYKPEKLLEAWSLLIEAAPELGSNDGFQYDLVDVTRQILVNYANVVQQNYSTAVSSGDTKKQNQYAREFLQIIDDADTLLATRRDFLLGVWLDDAKSLATTDFEMRNNERNARNIITTWGNKHNGLHDYANRQWSGLLKGFYKPRWQQFFAYVKHNQVNGSELDEKPFYDIVKTWEWGWVNSTETYATIPEGDPVSVATEIHKRYFPIISTAYRSKAN